MSHTRQATLSDIDQLVALMGEFYAESAYPLDAQRSAEAFRELLTDKRLGRVWLIESGGVRVGYMVITFGYSMEYGGADAFIDDLFIQPASRGVGLGSAVMEEARRFCLERGIRAIHLEAEKGNEPAQGVYRKAGFENNNRQLLTLRLAAPMHDI